MKIKYIGKNQPNDVQEVKDELAKRLIETGQYEEFPKKETQVEEIKPKKHKK